VIVWLVRTIRRRRRLEQERDTLLSTLQSRNQELARLGEVMAHHFQEPARRLVSFAQRLQGKAALADDEDSRQSLAFIDAQARRLSELVRDAQRYLALDHPRRHIGQADTATVFAAALQASGVTAAGAVVSLPSAWPAVCLPDKTLHELFVILLDNALRHTPTSGVVTVACGLADGRAWLSVEDSGPGIPESERSRIGERFYRPAGQTGDGCGLGLAIVREIARQHQGELHIDRSPRLGGALMRVDFPEAVPAFSRAG
jgi:signal transduction histidine kinase